MGRKLSKWITSGSSILFLGLCLERNCTNCTHSDRKRVIMKVVRRSRVNRDSLFPCLDPLCTSRVAAGPWRPVRVDAACTERVNSFSRTERVNLLIGHKELILSAGQKELIHSARQKFHPFRCTGRDTSLSVTERVNLLSWTERVNPLSWTES